MARDPELITLKGLNRVRAADVVVYDRLVARALLDEARPDAELIDVGKAPGRRCLRQEEINAVLVERAGRGRSLVRLKGGDGGIFGRLAEELRAVSAAGIPFEIVPGVTAACAAAAASGMSLTERGVASMVVFATGTDHTGHVAASLDWDVLGRTDATLVFYMAVRTLDTIAARLIASGRHPSDPAMVVAHASTTRQRSLRAPLGRIAAVARAAALDAPAIFITGATVTATTSSLVAPGALDAVGV